MNLRYYFRGLGTGIFIAVLALQIFTKPSIEQNLSEQQIRDRAKALGMVEGPVYLEELDVLSVNDLVSENAVVSDNATVLDNETVSDNTTISDNATTPDDASKSANTTQPTVKELVVVAVLPGEGSYSVAKKMYELGLVENAEEFDEYLCDNGYDKKLVVGNHEITTGDSIDEMATTLCRR